MWRGELDEGLALQIEEQVEQPGEADKGLHKERGYAETPDSFKAC